jgi:PPOX class probable FMN-dependent enzyme
LIFFKKEQVMSSSSSDIYVTNIIETQAQLREVIPDPGSRAKVIDSFEPQSRNFLAHSPFVAISTRRADGLAEVVARGGQPSFVIILDDYNLLIPDNPANQIGSVKTSLEVNPFVGLLFFIPGINETLRLNGPARLVGQPELHTLLKEVAHQLPQMEQAILVRVEELYMHCPKAFIRSHLWALDGVRPPLLSPTTKLTTDHIEGAIRSFIQAASFVCLGTALPNGQADLSPRGDPPGFVQILDEHTLLLPERPGNRLADSLANIVNAPTAGLLFLSPGSPLVLQVSGTATITKDPALLSLLAVKGKLPLLAIRLTVISAKLEAGMALETARLWQRETHINPKDFPTMGQIMLDQLRPRGILTNYSAEQVEDFIQEDARNNLY